MISVYSTSNNMHTRDTSVTKRRR